ncbi:MAG: LysE family transporter [Polaribacter sp.]|jgi:threonine/homoserine/homoserine lactone efflux protein|nr:LysE family transporter [Polaribacter sp.]
MNLMTHFIIGFLVAFIGSITPSMLNMTALKIRLQKNVKSAHKYVLGVSVVVLLQAYIAVVLSKYILENPTILDVISQFGIVIFILLSIYFYKESKKQKRVVSNQKNSKTLFFLTGLILSSLNMFAIPFYFGVVAFLDVFNCFRFDISFVVSFVVGTGAGTFSILFFYVKYAPKIQEKTGKLTKDINLVLSILTAFLALLSLLKIAYKLIVI